MYHLCNKNKYKANVMLKRLRNGAMSRERNDYLRVTVSFLIVYDVGVCGGGRHISRYISGASRSATIV